MGCTKNPKKFLWFKWLGSHNEKITYVSRFGSWSWAKYSVTFSCSRCGVTLGEVVHSESSLVAQGFDAKLLQGLDMRWGQSPEHLMPGYDPRPPEGAPGVRKGYGRPLTEDEKKLRQGKIPNDTQEN